MFGIKPSVEERAITSLPWGDWGDSGTASWSGKTVTTDTAMQLLTVYGCSDFIGEGISTLPIDEFRDLPDGGSEEIKKPGWLEEPTPDLSFIDWCSQVLNSVVLGGNAYCRLDYFESMQVREVAPLDPNVCSVRRERGRKVIYVNGTPAPSGSILHIKGPMWPGADVGMSPVEYARQTIGKGLAVEEFSARFFGQGMNLSGVIEDPGPPDSEKARMMARVWARLHAGNSKAHLPGVLQGGATWKPTGVTNEQAQFLQTQQFSAAQIASFLFRIDPSEFGLSMSAGGSITYANIEQRNVRKLQVTFLPWIVRLERALSSLLAKPRYVKFNVDGLLRGDTKTRFDTYLVASQINQAAAAIGDKPIMLTSEMRELEDLDPLADEDVPEAPKPAPVAVPAADEDEEPVEDEAKAAPVLSIVPDDVIVVRNAAGVVVGYKRGEVSDGVA